MRVRGGRGRQERMRQAGLVVKEEEGGGGKARRGKAGGAGGGDTNISDWNRLKDVDGAAREHKVRLCRRERLPSQAQHNLLT